MNLENLVDIALTALASAYYDNINYEPKYAKQFCELFEEAFNHCVSVADHQADYEELKGIA